MMLQNLMRKAIGDRSIAEFSSLCSISPEKISDLLYGRYDEFTETEIARIAGNSINGVTYTELLDYFKIEDAKQYTTKDLLDSLEVFANAVKFYVERLQKVQIDLDYQFVRDIVTTVQSYYPRVRLEPVPEFGIDIYWTDNTTMIINLSWTDHSYIVSWEFGIITTEDHTVDRVMFAKEELYRYGSKIASIPVISEGFADILDYDYAIEIKVQFDRTENMLKQFTAEENLLCNIFGDPTQPRTIEGYGFDLPCEYKLRKFCADHAETIKSVSAEKLNTYNDRRYGYVVAYIIHQETGIKVYPYATPETRCIMYPTKLPWDMSEYEKHITKKHLYSVLDKYARELGTTVKKCYVLTTKKTDSEFDDLDKI